jgi:hypothetical protein
MDYTFALRGDGEVPTKIVAPTEQRRALSAILATLKPETLALPESLLKIIPPRPPEYPRNREDFKIHTSPAFDALAPAESAAQHTLQFLFNPERAARLVEFHARNADNPGLDEVIDAVLNATWKSPHPEGYDGEVANAVDDVVLYDLLALAANDRASDQVRAVAWSKIKELWAWLKSPSEPAKATPINAHVLYAVRQIDLFEKDPKRIDLTPPVEPPDGPPIGSMGTLDCDWQP